MKPIMLNDPKELEFKENLEDSVAMIQNRIAKQKQEVVHQKLKEKKLLHILKDIKKKRFKPIQIEILEDREKVWIDNGTYKGLLLVTFLKATDAEIKDNQFKGKLLYF